MKNKIFIISEAWDGCYYYRAEVFARYSKKFQIKSNVDYKNGNVKNAYDCLNEIFEADIIIFVRPTLSQNYQLLRLLKGLGKTVVFSGDDSFATIDKKNPAYSLKKNLHINETFLRYSDYVITTTEYLKQEYQQINKNVAVIPNLIDFEEYSHLASSKKKPNTFRIGLVGSVHTAENVEKFMETLKKLHSKYKETEFVFFVSDDVKMVNELKANFLTRTEFVANVPITEYAKKLASLNLDIALIPRKDSSFNRSKSNCKYLELSALGISTIAQGFTSGDSPYQFDITSGVNGYIAIDDSEWEKYLVELHDIKKRKEIISNASRYVEEKFDIKKQISLWDENVYKMLPKNTVRVDKNEVEILKLGLTSLYKDKHRDQRIKNYKKEVKFLNDELERIRSRAYYRLMSKAMDVARGFKK